MRPALVLAVCLVLAPLAVVVGTGALMKTWTGYAEVDGQLGKVCENSDAQALYVRLGGYSVEQVAAHWALLDCTGLGIERRFQRADLLYPLCYGGTLASALLLGRRRAGLTLSPLATIAPVLAAILADWTENLVQLRQLDLFIQGGAVALEARWVSLASAATSLKWVSLGACLVLLVWVAWRVACEGRVGK